MTPPAVLERLAEPAPRRLKQGEYLFRQGDMADRLYLIEAGQLRMERQTFSGDRVSIHTGRAGELFAEGALFTTAYGCDAVAARPSMVRTYLKTAVLAAAAADPGLLLDLLDRVARQLHRARTLIELRSVRSAEERILRHLTLLADERGCVAFDRPLIDIAGELGLTHEAYYRALRALQRAGRLERSERAIRLAGAG